MLNLLFRGIVVYFFLIVSVRLMGKREIGQLQPADLVVTIIISNIASMPVEQKDAPLLQCVALIAFFVIMEIIMSIITLKLPKLRHVIQGNSLLVINDGKIDEKILRKMRLTVDDLVEALRLKDVFDISDVEYAYVETNGQISVKLKPEKSPVKSEDMKIKADKSGIPFVLISDGRVISESFGYCGTDEKKLDEILKSRRLEKKNLLILTADKSGVKFIAEKEKSKKGRDGNGKN